MMEIVLLNDYAYAEGGASRVALTQADGLARRNLAVTVFTAQDTRDDAGRRGWKQGASPPTWTTGQWDIARNPARADAVIKGIWNATAADQLAALLKKKDPQRTVLLLHSWTKALSGSVVRRATRMGFPVTAVLHDYFVACPNGAYHDFQQQRHCWRTPLSAACCFAHCDRHSYAQKGWRVLRHLTQTGQGGIPREMSSVICVSRYQRDILERWLPAGMACHILPNPVDHPPSNLLAGVRENREFLFVGRMSPEKGALVFAEAARRAGVPAAFVGDGEESTEVRKRLPAARMTGWLDAAQVWGELAKARALVFPSIWHESFGLSVYEAAALGIPSIVSDHCAAADFVRDGVNGLVFRQGDAGQLAERLAVLEADSGLAVALGARARTDFLDYSRANEGYFERLEEILARTLSAPKAG